MTVKTWMGSWGRASAALVFCGGMTLQAVAASAPASGSDGVWDYLNGLPEQERMEVLEHEAAKEGGLTIYGALGIDRADVLIKFFNEKYPDIDVDFVRLREPELVERVNTESRAGRVGGDLAISSAN